MKFAHNNYFDKKFSSINQIRFYPYVGKNYNQNEKKILVLAHNIYCPIEKYESEQIRTASKTHFADALEEYTYDQGWWTKTFRNFIKGTLALKENFTRSSSDIVIKKVDSFIESISYTNYINDLVPSNNANNIAVNPHLIKLSSEINNEIYKILETSHIFCWGKNVFNYIINQENVNIVERTNLLTKSEIKKQGFEYAKILIDNQEIHLLKIFHPSMPKFGHKKEDTRKIIEWFMEK
ncbi:hypothetical protein [Soonwooa sp.]|uniref:hypothetical protein n=1 Tax=Soonwooa sp. TaxID=1938592 RepID=UPI0028AB29C7|nr:hypothetical protein [Soonwooa sp.]